MDIENADTYAPSNGKIPQQPSLTSSDSSIRQNLPVNANVKRKKRPNFSGLKTIQVKRGPDGYGFTLCGNAPCCLDAVAPGSEAKAAGLAPGQYLMTINGENVSNSTIKEVITLIMDSPGTLTLNVAQDDDEDSIIRQAQQRVKPRIRPRSSSNYPIKPDNGALDQKAIELATADILSGDAFNAFFHSRSESLGGYSTSDRSPKNSLSSVPSSLGANPTSVRSGTLSSFSSLEVPVKSTTSVSTARTQNLPDVKTSQSSLIPSKPRDPREPVNGESKSSLRNLNNSDDICSAAETGRFYAVVGYVGTIDTPAQMKDHSSILAHLQSAIKRMQSETRSNFVLLLEISDNNIRLINSKNVTVTCIEFDAILSCFVAGETKHYFGILAQSCQKLPAAASNGLTSCMLLCVDPQISNHSIHLKAAKKFSLACTRITSSLCKEFPLECSEIVTRIQAKAGNQKPTSEINPNPGVEANNNNVCGRTSSNSDSGIIVCKDKTCKLCSNGVMNNGIGFPNQSQRQVINQITRQSARIPTPVNTVSNLPSTRQSTLPVQSQKVNNAIETPSQRFAEHRSTTNPPSTGQTMKSQHVHDFVYGTGMTSSHNLKFQLPGHTSSEGLPDSVPKNQQNFSGGATLGRIANWAASFDNLLKDPEGVEVFTEFLKKEFAEENIIFYQYCQHYKLLADSYQAQEFAMRIFNQHLANGCPHPVNVDNQVLMNVCEKLSNNLFTKDLFDEAQLQIYKLMKFDPYSRFLKNEMYINCVKAGASNQNPEKKVITGNQSVASSEATSEESNPQDGRKGGNLFQSKKSLLPWKRKPKLSNVDLSSDSSMKSLEKSKGLSQSSDSLLLTVPSSSTLESQTQCRVYLPNGCHVVIDCAKRESVGSTISALCNDYNLKMKCLEIVDSDHKPINSGETIQNYGGREIYLERRVYFRVELPSSQNIGVKSKPNISIKDVFQPLLVKYCLSLNNLVLRLHDSTNPLNLQLAVAVLDSKKVVAETIEQYTLHTFGKENQMQGSNSNQSSSSSGHRRTSERPSAPRRQQPADGPVNIISGHQLHQQQIQHQINPVQPNQGVNSVPNSGQLSQHPPVTRASKKPGLVSRPQAMIAPSQRAIRPSNEEHNVYSSHETDGHHHKLETTSLSNQTDLNPENGHLFGLLAKVQGSRMDNQRGIMSISKLEMPSFLEPQRPGVLHNHSTPEKWANQCCPSSSCLHLMHDSHLQSTMIHPAREQNGGIYRKPPSGKHRKGGLSYDQRRPLIESHLGDNNPSSINPRALSKLITPIPGHIDNYYYISDDSAFDINPSQLPSPSSEMYPIQAPAPSTIGSPDTFSSSIYPDHLYPDQGFTRRRQNTKVSSMTRSNSTEWLEQSSSYDSRENEQMNPMYPSGAEASTFSSSMNRPASNLHYPSTASNQSWQSNQVNVQSLADQEMSPITENSPQEQMFPDKPKVYHV